MLAAGEIADPA
jgi:hypothetical protein